jgi:hypothetical protein
MSRAFFNKTARLTIGKPSGGKISGGLLIETPLRIAFEISKTEVSEPNQATVTINNLSDKTRNLIRQGSGMVCIIEAGYVDAGGLQQIFYGDMMEVNHTIMKPDIETVLVLMDGHKSMRESRLSVSYRRGTPISQVIKDAATSLGTSVNATFEYVNLPTERLEGSISYSGNTSTWLDKLCSDNGLQWSIQNGSLKIYEAGKSDNLPPLKSQLVGSPKRLFRDTESTSDDNFSGYEFNCLLLPKCEPGNRVTIQSIDIPKPITLQVAEVKHKGDYYGEDWTTTVKARDL